MKTIELSKGYYALVDDEEFDLLNRFSWSVSEVKNSDLKYASTSYKICGIRRNISMHRLIMGAKKGVLIDHKDNDGLNNQKFNLREATFTQNLYNSRKRKTATSSKYKGVSIDRRKREYKNKKGKVSVWNGFYYMATITVNGAWKTIGLFKTELEAAKAYDQEAIKNYGEFAKTNF